MNTSYDPKATVVQISEHDWIELQVALAELKSRVRDLELRASKLESDVKYTDSCVQLLAVDAGY